MRHVCLLPQRRRLEIDLSPTFLREVSWEGEVCGYVMLASPSTVVVASSSPPLSLGKKRVGKEGAIKQWRLGYRCIERYCLPVYVGVFGLASLCWCQSQMCICTVDSGGAVLGLSRFGAVVSCPWV